ncbi:hypothetical protein [Aeromonas media]|uniref:hypothetical protein n=1 Tax=Aeromonas media TaxID=651 RepID=UPI00384D61C7
MEALFEFLKTYGTQISAFGASITFIFGAYKYQSERKVSHFWREFEAYHRLVKELIEPPTGDDAMYVDRQTAAIYELRFYKCYFLHSLRMLKALKEKWDSVPDQFPLVN